MVRLGCTVRGAAIGHKILSPKLLVRCQTISNVVAVPAREIQYQVLRLSWPLQRKYTHKPLCQTPLQHSIMDRALAISIFPRSSTLECKISLEVFNNVGAFSPAKQSTGLNVNLEGLSTKSGPFRDLDYPIVVHSSSKRGATTGTSAKEKEGTTEGQQVELQLYNTMNKQKEVFRPPSDRESEHVRVWSHVLRLQPHRPCPASTLPLTYYFGMVLARLLSLELPSSCAI